MATVSEALATALGHHQAGRLEKAEEMYRGVLRLDAEHPHGLHLLGIVCHQQGKNQSAIEYLDRAIPLAKPTAEIYTSRAAAHLMAGHIGQGIDDCRRALEIDPRHAPAHANLAHGLNEREDFEEAEASSRRALEIEPDSASTHLNLGRALRGQDKLEEARAAYERSLQLDPNRAQTHDNLGNLLRQDGKLDEARASYRRALELDPSRAKTHDNLAKLLLEDDKFEEAVASCRRSVELDPEQAETHNELGEALCADGKLDEAMTSLRRALEIQPDYVAAYNNMGLVLRRRQDFDAAAAAFKQALQIDPDYVPAHENLGAVLLEKRENPDEALACFRRALEIQPDFVPAIAKLAAFYEKRNDLEKAMKYVTKGLDIAPEDLQTNVLMAKCAGRRGDFQDGIERLDKVLSKCKNRVHDKTAKTAHHCLGHFRDRCGQTAEAFAHFVEANRLDAQDAALAGFDKARPHREIGVLRRLFQPAWIESWTPAPPVPRDETPAFMIGFPRSGTTLLDQILDSHPRIQTLEERPTFAEVYKEILGYSSPLAWVIPSLSPGHFSQLRDRYFRAVDRYLERQPGLLLIDRNPFRTRDAGLLYRLFPAARFIFMVRHPCDVCLSCFMQSFAHDPGTVNFFTLHDAAALYAKVMDLWQHYLRVLPIDYHMVRYEDLLDDFEGETRRLLDYLEVGWDEAVRRHTEHARGRTLHTASYHQVVEPLYRRARYRWQRYAEQLAPVMDVLKPYIDYFGYS